MFLSYSFFLILLPLLGSFTLAFFPSTKKKQIFQITLAFAGATFLLALALFFGFDPTTADFQFVTEIVWVAFFNTNLSFGVDGISLFFILLTTFLIPLTLIGSWHSVKRNEKEYCIFFLLVEGLLLAVFMVLDLVLFYIFFESLLIPMFFIIGIWGSRQRKVRAAYMFFLYTLVGSLLMLVGILYLFQKTGTTNYESLLGCHYLLLPYEEKIIWVAFFLSFGAKVPLFPIHIWLPEAHVEAPTAGSVLLAGILLKLGSYALLRFSLPLFPSASLFFSPFVMTLTVLGVVYSSLTAIRQTDLKRIIAYTSVAHMNVVVLGIFSFSETGLKGAIFQSLSHGFVSSALFFLIGVLYDRYHTRIVTYYNGIVYTMPLFVGFFFFFTMANIGFPGTSNFVGEFLIFVGSYQINPLATFFGATGMILGGGYALWLLNRMAYGNLKTQYIASFTDLNTKEFFLFVVLTGGTLLLGIYPNCVLTSIHTSVAKGGFYLLAL
jgi:proton-translocating NADH-quinone oxidoreductase chain M